MKKLYTAFKGKNNTSCQLISVLQQESLLLTNSFQGLEKDICSMVGEYSCVIMLGVDKSLKNEIRLETCADYRGEMIRSAFCTEILTIKCDELKIPYQVSDKPTGYLCNAAYWHMLKKVPNAIFLHIPSAKWASKEWMESLVRLLV